MEMIRVIAPDGVVIRVRKDELKPHHKSITADTIKEVEVVKENSPKKKSVKRKLKESNE